MWTAWICDTMTGERRQRLTLPSATWSRIANATGRGNAAVNLLDSATAKLPVRDLTELVRNSLVLEFDGTAVYCGVLWDRTYSRKDATLSLQHADIRSIFAARKALRDGGRGWPVTTGKLSWTNVALSTIVKRLVQAGLDVPNGQLPIDLPDIEEPGTATRTVDGWDLPYVDDLLDNISNVDGGPDIDFRPVWKDDRLRLVLRTGTTASPMILGDTHEWNLGARSPGIDDLTVVENAEKMAGRIWGVGDGMEESMLLARQPGTSAPSRVPMLEREISRKTVKEQSTLDSHARAAYELQSTPTVQWKMAMRSGSPVSLAKLKLGDLAKVYVQDDPWIPDGWHTNRIIEYSGDLTTTAKLDFQPLKA